MKELLIINGLIGLSLGLLTFAIKGVNKGKRWTLDLKMPSNWIDSKKILRLDEVEKIGFQLKFMERLEIKYLHQSGLSGTLPFLRLYMFFLVSGLCAFGLSNWIWSLFKIEGLVVSAALIGGVLPFQSATLYGVWRNRKLIQSLPGFYSVLQRWAQIQEDIYYCLGQLEQSGVDERLSKPFSVFILESTTGVSKGDAFFHLAQKFQGTPLVHFIKCLEHMTEQRGDLVKLLQGFENESYQLQTEMSDRQEMQVKYALLINGLSVAAFMLIYLLLKTNRILSDFYVETLMGKALLSLLAFMMAISFLGGLKYGHR